MVNTGVINIPASGGAGVRRLYADVDNQGAGQLNVQHDLTVMTGYTLTNGGSLVIASPRTLTLSSGSAFTHTGGSFSGNGTLIV